jgi:superfamily I DNA/RNA helicase
MFASVEQRKALLQGLFDTDGSVTTTSGRLHVSYSTSSEMLCKDVVNLLLTFGIVSSVREDKRGKRINYEIRVNCSKEKAMLLFSLPRKLKKVYEFDRKIRRDYSKVAVRSIEKLPEKKETMCVYVEDDQHLYLTKDFIVTHNTTRLIKEVAKELEIKRPEEIAFVTFTRKGAEEGLRRVCSKLMYDADDLPYFRTLHSLTFHAMNYKANQMFSKLDQRKFNKEFGYCLNRTEVNTGKVAPTKDSAYLDFYDLERSGALTSKQLAEADIEIGYYRQLVRKYEEYKSSNHLVDFFDCLIKYVQEGEPLPCTTVFIDEAQDISALQWKVIEKAFVNAEKIFIAGDDKQSIFSYSGARPDILIGLSRQFPVEHLSMSYRLPKRVYELANAVTDFIGEKSEQESIFREDNIEGNIAQLSDIDRVIKLIDEPKQNEDKTQWFLLTRNNCFIPEIEKSLEDALIPYWTSDGFFMGGQIMQRLKDYEGFKLEGYKDSRKREEFQRKFGIEDFSEPFTETNLFTEERKWVYASYIEKYGLDNLEKMCKWNPQILVSTIHYVKGGEADNVAVLLDATKRTKGNVSYNIDEELRILYVGITRAKRNLYLIDSKNGDGYDEIIATLRDQYGFSF